MPARFQQSALQALVARTIQVRSLINLSVIVAIIGIIVVGVGNTPLAEWAA